MGAAAVILFALGFTTYTLISPAFGVAMWCMALVLSIVSIVRWATGERRANGRSRANG